MVVSARVISHCLTSPRNSSIPASVFTKRETKRSSKDAWNVSFDISMPMACIVVGMKGLNEREKKKKEEKERSKCQTASFLLSFLCRFLYDPRPACKRAATR